MPWGFCNQAQSGTKAFEALATVSGHLATREIRHRSPSINMTSRVTDSAVQHTEYSKHQRTLQILYL